MIVLFRPARGRWPPASPLGDAPAVMADRTLAPVRVDIASGPPYQGDAPWQPTPAAKPQPLLPSYLRAGEVAAILQVSPKTVSRWVKEGKLPFLKTLGGHRRYPAEEIRQLADDLQVQPTA